MEKGEGGLPDQLYENTTNHSRNPIMQIPRELMEFVRRDTYSLLVKGDAGSGKTTLSLTILRALRIKTNFFYISTRLSPKQLFVYYPWLGKYMDNVNQDEIPPQASSQRTSHNAPSFEDARLDEPESLFERITNQLMDVKAPIIIIDSWDAVASFMDKEARLNNERVLQTWRERAGAKLIFISENPNDTTLDFLVDGIVNLTHGLYSGLRIREITLTKLRGIRISKFCYLFSLNNGTFKSYNPSAPIDFLSDHWEAGSQNSNTNLKRVKRDIHAHKPDLTKFHRISSGYKQLDLALGGGFPRKSFVFLRAHAEVSTKMVSLLLAGMISKILMDGNSTLIENCREIDAELIESYLRRYLPSERNDLLTIFSRGTIGERVQDHPTSGPKKTSKSKRVFGSISDAMYKTKRKYPNRLLASVIGLEACSDLSQLGEPNDAVFMRDVFAKADLTFVVGTQASSNDFSISGFDIHFYVQHVRGTLVLQADVPETHPFAIVIERSAGYPVIKLESLI